VVKKLLSVVLIVLLMSSTAFAQQAQCRESERLGEEIAEEEHRSAGWFWGSFGGYLFFGILGSGAVLGFAALGDPPDPDTYPEDAPLRECYEDGYGEAAQRMNTRSALWGGVAGLGTRVVVATVAYVVYFVVVVAYFGALEGF
jgi:hypothetical protein